MGATSRTLIREDVLIKKWAYYNEWDPYAAQWLRELMKAGLIMQGEVDERSITDVQADDVRGFIRVGFFAGIGGWEEALRIANWPADKEVWHGSCPCQSYSVAGKGRGNDDARNLWPEFRRLIAECRPERVFGEQVANAIKHGWLDGISADLEAEGYAVGATVLGAHSVGAPHIRPRLYWVADSQDCNRGSGECGAQEGIGQAGVRRGGFAECGVNSGMANTHGSGWMREGQAQPEERRCDSVSAGGSTDSRMGVPLYTGLEGYTGDEPDRNQPGRVTEDTMGPTTATGCDCWSDYIPIPCGDGKTRRIEPGLMPLVNGFQGRVSILRPKRQAGTEIQTEIHEYNRVGAIKGFGNAIVPELAAEFIMAHMEGE